MSKSNASALAFLQKSNASNKPENAFIERFEGVKPASASGFRGMFGDFQLGEKDKINLQLILNEHYQPSQIPEEQVVNDYEELIRITSEIKAINSQSVLLHGERIKKAQDLLKNYRNGAFSEWLVATYGNRSTPYGMLRYFELYMAVPHHAKAKIDHIPKKAVYILASIDADINTKIKIIENYEGENQKDIILLIKEILPTIESDKRRRKTSNENAFQTIEELLKKLLKRKDFFTDTDKITVNSLFDQFKLLISID